MHTSVKSPGDARRLDLSRIAQDLQIKKVLVENVVQLLDEENTIPFIARYRKERTGGLDEEILRTIQDRLRQLRKMADRKQTILKSLNLNKLLTPELEAAILAADHPKRLEDLYLPYKKKDKATRADKARERGLGGLADAVWYADPIAANLGELLPTMLNPEKELTKPEDVMAGVADILAERIAESAEVRDGVRRVMWDTGSICTTKSEKLGDHQGLEYKGYFQFTEPLRHIPAHRVLAINRGEKENALVVKIDWDMVTGLRVALDRLPLPPEGATPPPPPIVEPAAAVPMLVAETVNEVSVAAIEIPPSQVEDKPIGGEVPENVPVPDAVSAVSELVLATPEVAAVQPESAPTVDTVSEPPVATANIATMPGVEQTVPIVEADRERPPRGQHGRPIVPPAPSRRPVASHPHAEFLLHVTEDALARLLVPSLEREIRRELSSRAEQHAVSVFARNLRSKLLAPPLRGKRVLAVDPAFRTGCKLAALDEIGTPLEDAVVFPNPPQNKKHEAKHKLEEMIRAHQLSVIAIGNGTACRETEEVISELIAELAARRSGASAPTTEVAPIQAPAASAAMETAPTPAPAAIETPMTVAEIATSPIAIAETPAQEVASLPMPPTATTAVEDAKPPTVEMETAVAAAVEAPQPQPAPLPSLDHLPEAPADLAYIIVNEAGASVYSASPVGREEFPSLDATLRGTISIGRRLQDPLSELVKIDPQHIGVGLYQHDVHLKQLRDSLDAVVESCVNTVGVDLNTASVPLLRHISGFNTLVARDLVEYRQKNGPFKNREQLIQVPNIGERRFTQAAGFLKILDGSDPLDRTWVHPESYALARQVLADLGYGPEVLTDDEKLPEMREKFNTLSLEELSRRLDAGVPTVHDILEALARPGRDPREDLPPPVFKKSVLKIEDLQAGMDLQGTVLNVVDFGAFVDVGLKESGLVHISQMANRFVKNPHEITAVGDVVTVWVLKVDADRHHVSLSMIAPGTERKPAEKRSFPPRREGAPMGDRQPQGEGGRRPPRGDRPPPRGDRQPQGQRPQPAVQEQPQPQGDGQRPPPHRQPQGDRQAQGDRPAARGGRPQGGDRRGQAPAAQGGRRALPPRGSRRQDAPGRGPGKGPGGSKPPLVVEPPPSQEQPAARKPQGKSKGAKPNLSDAALSGREALNTFGELAAFWEARSKQEPEQEAPVAAPPAEDGPPTGS